MGVPAHNRSISPRVPPHLAELFESLYPKLKIIARSRLAQLSGNQTLSATALVNETYIKLAQVRSLSLQDQRHFLVYCARAMRTLVIDYLRERAAVSRGGNAQPVTWTDALGACDPEPVDVMDIDRAINHLTAIAPDLIEIVEMKFGCGMTIAEISQMTGDSIRTVNRNWSRARAIMLAFLRQPGNEPC